MAVVVVFTGALAIVILSLVLPDRPHRNVSADAPPTTGYGTPSRTEVNPPGPPRTSSASPALNEFIGDCRNGVDAWKAAQVDYPKTVALEKGVPGIYVAAIDVRDVPLPPAQVIPGRDPQSAAIAVQCLLSARLVGDGSMTVDPPEWVAREFNPAGILNWSWSVTAGAPGSRSLRLELQPAIVTGKAGLIAIPGGASQQTLTYVTVADVSAPPAPPAEPRGFWQGVADSWKVISAVGAGAAAAVLGAVVWLRKLGVEVHGLRKAWQPPKPAADEDPPGEGDAGRSEEEGVTRSLGERE